MKKIGITLIASPFITLFGYGCSHSGIAHTLKAFGLTTLILIVFAVGVIMATTDKEDLLEMWDFWKWERSQRRQTRRNGQEGAKQLK